MKIVFVISLIINGVRDLFASDVQIRLGIKGKTYYHRRCRKCLYDESATSNTLFHDLKMPLLKAFQMTFRIAGKKKGMSTVELGAEVGVQQKTA